jgi:hypothetical protein
MLAGVLPLAGSRLVNKVGQGGNEGRGPHGPPLLGHVPNAVTQGQQLVVGHAVNSRPAATLPLLSILALFLTALVISLGGLHTKWVTERVGVCRRAGTRIEGGGNSRISTAARRAPSVGGMCQDQKKVWVGDP